MAIEIKQVTTRRELKRFIRLNYERYKDNAFAADLRGALTVTDSYDKAFRFYHLYGPHIGADWDENLAPRPADAEEDYPAVLRGSFRNIEDYIQQQIYSFLE